MADRRGFTMIEMLVVVVLIGIITLMIFPLVRDMNIKNDVRSARSAVSALYVKARSTAIATSRPTTLKTANDSLWLTQSIGGVQTVVAGSTEKLNSRYGVTVTTSGDISLTPTGLVTTGTDTITVTKSGVSQRFIVSGYGRVQ